MNPKILLVDDNEDLLLITQIILKGQGYEIFLARTLEEAERKIKIHQPALLLLDVCVGDEDGRLFCQKIKTTAELSHLRVILMSGDDCQENRLDIADDFLSKPFDFNELLVKVNTALAATTA